MHLVPLANIGQESSKEVPKIKKKKKKSSGGDMAGQPIVGVQPSQLQPPQGQFTPFTGKHANWLTQMPTTMI